MQTALLKIKSVLIFFADITLTIFDLRLFPKYLFDKEITKTYYPEEKRKPFYRRLYDFVWWYFRWGEVNTMYYMYGLDTKEAPSICEYIGKRRAVRMRNKINQNFFKEDYSIVLKDKFVFANYFKGVGLKVCENICFINNGKMLFFNPDYNSITDFEDSGAFYCKNIYEDSGKKIYYFYCENNKLFVNNKVEANDFFSNLKGAWLIQKSLKQHSHINKFQSKSACSVKFNTIISDDKVELIYSFIRFGNSSDYVDNWRTGSCLVQINIKNGKLMRDGFYKVGKYKRLNVHPDTGLSFKDFQIPFYKEAVDLVKKAHLSFPMIKSIGWDIIITNDGPVILEGNHDWDIITTQILFRNGWKEWFYTNLK